LLIVFVLSYQKNGYLTINDSLSNSKWGFYIASQVDTISNYVKLGKKEFLIHYFGKNRSTKYNLTEINPIVCQLFDWGIITYYGNELPRLYIIKPSILSIITKNSLRKCKKCNTKTILIILNKYISAYNKTVEEWDKE
jgi:hypothetical protein